MDSISISKKLSYIVASRWKISSERMPESEQETRSKIKPETCPRTGSETGFRSGSSRPKVESESETSESENCDSGYNSLKRGTVTTMTTAATADAARKKLAFVDKLDKGRPETTSQSDIFRVREIVYN